MGITVSGLSSNLPISTWIEQLVAVKQEKIDSAESKQTALSTSQSALSTIKSNYSSLLSSMQKITDSSFGSLSDLFAQKSVTSSDSTKISATVSALASAQTVKVAVSHLATATTAQSTDTVSAKMTGTTLVSALAGGDVTAGDFSVYVDNTKYTISVATTDTLNSVMSQIGSKTGLSASITDGKLTINDPSGLKNIVVGSNSDTTNFTRAVGLTKVSDSSYASSNSVLLANSLSALTGTGAGLKSAVTAGTFEIGNATFTIDANTTMQDLISEINGNEDAGVTAYWDVGSGKLVLNSTTEGAANINVEAGTSNFTDVMGLTTSTWNPNGSVATTMLRADTQTLGENAIFTINGTTMTSPSNTVTSDITGVQGLTLKFEDETTSDTTITIGANTTSATSAITSFVNAFNTAIANTDEATGSDGYLNGESVLTMIRNRLRSTVTSAVDGADGYKTLASIGITTGDVGASLDANTNKLVIDSEKLAAALTADPEAVKKLLIGDGTNAGVLTNLKSITEDAVDPQDGYFVTKYATFTNQIDDLQESIDKQTKALEDYRTSLENKFALMEKMIASLNSQLSTVQAVIDQTSNNK